MIMRYLRSLPLFALGLLCAAGNASAALADGTQLILRNPLNSTPRVISLWGGAGSEQIVLKSDGTVWVWGWNMFGEQGNGTTNNTGTPHQVLGPGGVGLLTNLIAIMGGETHNAALRADGTVWEWGRNYFGELGDGSNLWGNLTNMSTTPVQVIGLNSVKMLGGRGYHDLAEKIDGSVWAWGDNQSGELGCGSNFFGTNRPVQVSGLTNPVVITGGGFYSAALMADGTVRTWGNNSYGQCGDGTTNNHPTWIQVSGLSNIVALSGGWIHVLAVRADGTAWTWGDNSYGEIGDGGSEPMQLSPVQVAGLSNVVSVSGGDLGSLARLADGTVWTWGYNGYGQLGIGAEDNVPHPLPAQVPGLSNVVDSAARDYHCICVKRDGTVWTWGDNRWGGGGDLTGSNVLSPRLLSGLVSNAVIPYVDSSVRDVSGTLTNLFCPSFYTNVWLDATIQATIPVEDVPAPPDAAFALCVTTNGSLAVWNRTNPPAAGNGWTVLQDVNLGTDKTFRATVEADYTPDANGLFYYSVWINGVASTNPATRYATADASQPWFGDMLASGNFTLHNLAVTSSKPFYTLTTTSTGYGGTVLPNGSTIVAPGSTNTFSLVASNWYHVASVVVDGINIGAPASYTFTNVQADHSLIANYSADLAAHNTPKWWLYLMDPDWSTNFDDAALGDQDGDGVPTWQEFIAGTDPLSASSALSLTIAMNNGYAFVTLPTIPTTPQYEAQRYYSLETTADPGSPTSWTGIPGLTNILATGQPVTYTNPVPGEPLYFRALVWLQ